MSDYEFVGYQSTLAMAFFIASVSMSFGQGFQYQGVIYVLVIIFGAFTNEQFLTITLLYCISLILSALARFSRS